MSRLRRFSFVRARRALTVFLVLRGLELASIVAATLAYEWIHQLAVGTFPSLPLMPVLVPFGLYIGSGYLAIMVLVFVPTIAWDLHKTPIGLIALNTLPLVLLGGYIFATLFENGHPVELVIAWLSATAMNACAAFWIYRTRGEPGIPTV